MNRLTPVDTTTAKGKVKTMLDAVQVKLGITPNMVRIMAQSPAVLEAYLSFSGALAGGGLDAKLREQIALISAEENICTYCLSAHSFIGKSVGLEDAEIKNARDANSADPRAKEALKFAQLLIKNQGQVSDAEVARLRSTGFSDGQIGEIIANVALNIFTNYFNNVTKPDVDFPVIEPRRLAAA